jgi:hypothetical protein
MAQLTKQSLVKKANEQNTIISQKIAQLTKHNH